MNEFTKRALALNELPFIAERVKKVRIALILGAGKSIDKPIQVEFLEEMIAKKLKLKDYVIDPGIFQSMHSNEKKTVELLDRMVSRGVIAEDLTPNVEVTEMTPIPFIISFALSSLGFSFGDPYSMSVGNGKKMIDQYSCKKNGKMYTLYFDVTDVLKLHTDAKLRKLVS